jgi:hypothetical protein
MATILANFTLPVNKISLRLVAKSAILSHMELVSPQSGEIDHTAEVVQVQPWSLDRALANLAAGHKHESETARWKKESRVRAAGVERDLFRAYDIVNGREEPQPGDKMSRCDWFVRLAMDHPKKFADLLRCLIVVKVDKNVTVTPVLNDETLDQMLTRRHDKVRQERAAAAIEAGAVNP